ncbi:MAG: hypothetical protein LBP22_00335 [Deltaproteobacteria bacterium]|jgi:hypothetical protein|nr:hypothetical protein [Deltaproteobacteria bacterium]
MTLKHKKRGWHEICHFYDFITSQLRKGYTLKSIYLSLFNEGKLSVSYNSLRYHIIKKSEADKKNNVAGEAKNRNSVKRSSSKCLPKIYQQLNFIKLELENGSNLKNIYKVLFDESKISFSYRNFLYHINKYNLINKEIKYSIRSDEQTTGNPSVSTSAAVQQASNVPPPALSSSLPEPRTDLQKTTFSQERYSFLSKKQYCKTIAENEREELGRLNLERHKATKGRRQAEYEAILKKNNDYLASANMPADPEGIELYKRLVGEDQKED